MGMSIGKVVGQSIESYRGLPATRMIEVQLLGESPETVEWINVTGEDTAPVNGDKVIVFNLGSGYKITLGTKDQIVAAVASGDKKLYARSNSDTISVYLHLRADGKIELGDGTNELLKIMNDNLTEVINALKYLRDTITFTNSGGPTGPPTNAALLTPIITNLENTQSSLQVIKA